MIQFAAILLSRKVTSVTEDTEVTAQSNLSNLSKLQCSGPVTCTTLQICDSRTSPQFAFLQRAFHFFVTWVGSTTRLSSWLFHYICHIVLIPLHWGVKNKDFGTTQNGVQPVSICWWKNLALSINNGPNLSS